MIEIVVVDRQRGRRTAPTALRAFLRRLWAELPPPSGDGLVVCLVSDLSMRGMNRAFRGQDRPTDVLSFPGDGVAAPDGRVHLGDIAIAVPTAERQARSRGLALGRELKTLALHGYLHLLGYDHESDDGRMRRLERRLAARLLGSAAPRPGRRAP